MPLSEAELPEVYLRPGEFFVARKPTILRTILGSCVGVTFWSPRQRFGALSHSMLPRAPKDLSHSLTHPECGKYVDSCIRDLARRFDEFGARRSDIEVKVFGGADVLMIESCEGRPTIGRLNCNAAIEVLREEGFGVTASSLGGTCGCKIRFNTETGEVMLSRLS